MKDKIIRFMDSPVVFAIGLGFIAAAIIWAVGMEWAFHKRAANGQTVLLFGEPPSRQHYIYSTNGF